METPIHFSAAAIAMRAANASPSARVRLAPITPATNRAIQQRLGRAIRQRRRMLDLTLQDIAASCGVTFQQVHKYESGLCSMSASQLWCIAVALETPVAYFYDALVTPELVAPADPDIA